MHPFDVVIAVPSHGQDKVAGPRRSSWLRWCLGARISLRTGGAAPAAHPSWLVGRPAAPNAAAAALEGYAARIEAQFPLARLHLARGDHDLAAAVARRAARTLAGTPCVLRSGASGGPLQGLRRGG
jgi:hypothetical protein